jgi:hypothetical protein
MPSPARVGDRVTVVNTYRVSERHLNGREGVVDVVLVGSGPSGRTGYRVKLDTGQLVLTYNVEPVTVVPAATEILVDTKRAQAAMAAKDILPNDALVSDITELARFILGEPEPTPAPTNSVTVQPGALQVGTLVPAIDADRRVVNQGFKERHIEVSRDHAADNDLVRVGTGHGGSEYLALDEVERLIAYLQAAVRVGRQDGTRPPFPEPSDAPF